MYTDIGFYDIVPVAYQVHVLISVNGTTVYNCTVNGTTIYKCAVNDTTIYNCTVNGTKIYNRTVNGTTISNCTVKPHDILKVQKALLKSMSCVTECTMFKILHAIKALI